MARSPKALTCPLCGDAVDPRESLRWMRHGHPILRCPGCSLLFRGDLPTPDELVDLYSETYFRAGQGQTHTGEGYPNYLAEEELHRLNARKRLRLLSRFLEPGRLLDVGCAAGFFLAEARDHGWEVLGVEVAPTMAAFGREQLGLQVVEGPFVKAPLSASGFDCVTMWDYVEHTLDPVAELKRARELLRPGGILALSTGDAGSAVARLSGSRWHLLTPRHHNFFFSRRTLESALHRAGFRVRHARNAASMYSVHYLAHKLQTTAAWPGLGKLAHRLEGKGLGRVRVPINLFDIMTVIAEPA